MNGIQNDEYRLIHAEKDQCDKCYAYNVGNVSETNYVEHMSTKEQLESQQSLSRKEQ